VSESARHQRARSRRPAGSPKISTDPSRISMVTVPPSTGATTPVRAL
jgi:hypothetical protein